MVKMILGVLRKEGMTRSEFHEYLRNTHGPLVLSVPEFLRHLRKYVQNHGLMDPDGSKSTDVPVVAGDRDAIIELWFDGVEEIRRGLGEPRYLEIIRPDEARFSSFQELFVLLAREEWLLPRRDATARIKVFSFLKRKAGTSEKQFLEFWRETYGPLLTSRDAFKQHVNGYLQNHSIPGNPLGVGTTSVFDGVDEMWFQDVEAVKHFYGSPEILKAITENQAKFADQPRTLAVLTEELTVHDTISA
jgi:uncharacterized protein (TIGR02118 family)